MDSIVKYAFGAAPHRGKVGLCVYCGGDPTVARGHEAIGTLGCTCNPARPQNLTTVAGETSDQQEPSAVALEYVFRLDGVRRVARPKGHSVTVVDLADGAKVPGAKALHHAPALRTLTALLRADLPQRAARAELLAYCRACPSVTGGEKRAGLLANIPVDARCLAALLEDSDDETLAVDGTPAVALRGARVHLMLAALKTASVDVGAPFAPTGAAS